MASLIQLRRLDEAESELDRVEDLAQRRGHPSRLAAAARLRGQLADARRDHQTARAAFDKAIDLGDDDIEGVDADERAAAHLAYGTFLRRRGERRAAIEHAREARARYAALGARPFLQRADQLLNECGVPADSTDAAIEDAAIDDWASPLTPQERAVATLIATGRTNQQAANELVVSAKTIELPPAERLREARRALASSTGQSAESGASRRQLDDASVRPGRHPEHPDLGPRPRSATSHPRVADRSRL